MSSSMIFSIWWANEQQVTTFMVYIWGTLLCQSGHTSPYNRRFGIGKIFTFDPLEYLPRKQSSWGQHGAHLGSVGPRWAPCWPPEPCYLGWNHLTPCMLLKSLRSVKAISAIQTPILWHQHILISMNPKAVSASQGGGTKAACQGN